MPAYMYISAELTFILKPRKKLREMKEIFELPIHRIPRSHMDKARGVRLPPRVSPELAEETGIHIGDGYMGIFEKHGVYKWNIAGHLHEDKLYLTHYVIQLEKSLYGLNPTYIHYDKHLMDLTYVPKTVVLFKSLLGLPVGKKEGIDIPKIFIKNDDLTKHCLRGIVDTDGYVTFQKKRSNVHYYPRVTILSSSKPLILTIQRFLLSKLKLRVNTSFNKRYKSIFRRRKPIHVLHICGQKNFESWMRIIGFSNPANLTKFMIWKQHGFCPPNTTINQRIAIIAGLIYPESYYHHDFLPKIQDLPSNIVEDFLDEIRKKYGLKFISTKSEFT